MVGAKDRQRDNSWSGQLFSDLREYLLAKVDKEEF